MLAMNNRGIMAIKIVVPVSGGKDSQACLKLALQEYKPDEILGLFCDTKFEHPLTYKHIKWMSGFYGVEVRTVCAGSVPEQVIKNNRFPSGGARFCTDRLKLRPSKEFYKKLSEEQGGFEVWLGMRSDESIQREARYRGKLSTELYKPNDIFTSFPQYLYKKGVSFRLPILDWSRDEVFKLLNGEENKLYSLGSERVGCFPCLASGDKNKERDFAMDDFGRKQKIIVEELEQKIDYSVWTSKSGAIRNNKNQSDIFTGCAICAI